MGFLENRNSIRRIVLFGMRDEGANGAVSEKETMGKQEVLIKLQRYFLNLVSKAKRKKGLQCKKLRYKVPYCNNQ